MVYYLMICQSLTYAQRTVGVLERAGIAAHILRAPIEIAGEGCSHAVKVSERRLRESLILLKKTGLEPKKVYLSAADGSYQEARL